MRHIVMLCGLDPKLSQLVALVLKSCHGRENEYQVTTDDDGESPKIAILDQSVSSSVAMYRECLSRHPGLVPLAVYDSSIGHEFKYAIERRSLFLRLNTMLGDIVRKELAPSNVSIHPTVAVYDPSVPPGAALPRQDGPISTDRGALIAMVVDDSLTVREQIREALRAFGIDCIAVGSAAEALGLLQQYRFDLAMLDIVMPDMDGYELCRQIRHDDQMRTIPVVMLTSRSSPFDRARGALAGCDSYLTKPIVMQEFRQAVDRVLMKEFANDRGLLCALGYQS